jgi:hypothetical protein
MSQFTDLVDEFQYLKGEVFKDGFFVVLDADNEQVQRYQQLLGFFYPQFRTTDWVSPM